MRNNFEKYKILKNNKNFSMMVCFGSIDLLLGMPHTEYLFLDFLKVCKQTIGKNLSPQFDI